MTRRNARLSLFLACSLSRGVALADTPVLSVEHVVVSADATTFNVKIFLDSEIELAPFFWIGITWDPALLDFVRFNAEGVPSSGFMPQNIKPDPPHAQITEWHDTRILYAGEWLTVPTIDGSVRVVRSPRFIRGDANDDLAVDIADAIFTLSFLFRGGPAPACEKAADSNDDSAIDLSDPVHTLDFLFFGGRSFREPYPLPGIDPTPDELGCGG